MKFERVIIVILDACGVGELPDADQYGDRGAATLPNLARSVGGLNLPTLESLGLGCIASIEGVEPAANPKACFGSMAERSAGKDSTYGHWELAGLILEKPFPVFPNGFPQTLVDDFEKQAQVKTVGNKAASGTEIIKELGAHHIETGEIILYTSADSVFQLAAHESIIPVDRLYEICSVAREMLTGEFGVGRVIARPFIGEVGNFMRTSNRRDFSLLPPRDTVLDLLVRNEKRTLAIGKIFDLFGGQGISDKIKTRNNNEVMDAVIDFTRDNHDHCLAFANCVDFDEKYGHRNDEKGFARALEEFDQRLAQLLPQLRENDLLIITADHGCDPTIKTSTDHSREYVPLLVYGPKARSGVNLGVRKSFADVGRTIEEIFLGTNSLDGESFLDSIRIN